jgi:hypothetical protein
MTAVTATKPTAIGVVRTSRHLYYFDGAGPWPSVTTITDVLDKPALTTWKQKQVAEAAIANAERLIADRESGNLEAAVAYLLAIRTEGTNSRERGTRIHAALESVLRREPLLVEDRDMPAVAGARAWLNEHSVKPLEVEAFLINETVGYGGTCDLIAEIDGETWLLDWKSGKSVAWPNGKVYDEMRLQLAAYSRAEFSARVSDPERYPLPAIQKHGVLHVTDGGTKLYPAEVTDADWTAFRAALYLHQWRAGKAQP